MKKNKNVNFLSVTVFLLIVGVFIFVAAAQIKSSNSIESQNDLQITISSQKDSYLLGETVFLDF